MKFSELTQCPHCGCEEFFILETITAEVERRKRFDGKEIDTSNLQGRIIRRDSTGRIYCADCKTYLGYSFTDKLDHRAEKILLEDNRCIKYEKSYNEQINTSNGRVKGCAYCEDKFKCPNAFTHISHRCGAYDNSLMNQSTKK